MENKLILKSKYIKEYKNQNRTVIRATEKVYNIIEELRLETGLTRTKILEKLVEFAYKYVEIEYEED